MQTVYIDIFFLINFSMDFLSLFIASRLLSRKVRLWRLALSALLGGAYACASLVFSFSAHLGVFSLAVDALACLLMAFIVIFSRAVHPLNVVVNPEAVISLPCASPHSSMVTSFLQF